jgi:hypothetical protein
MLLGLSILSIFIVRTGAMPTKIGALGIEFGTSDQQAFLVLLASILFYFVIAFSTYAFSDYIAWRKELVQVQIDGLKAYWIEQYRGEPDGPLDATVNYDEQKLYEKNRLWFSLTSPVSRSRAAVEFLLPTAVGVCAFGFVVFKACVIA